MMSDPDAVRRWTRTLSALRGRRVKLRRPNPSSGTPLDDLLDESLATCGSLLQDLAGTQLICDHLRRELHGEALNRQYLLEQMPVACVMTDDASAIQHANQPAAELFNISAKHLRGRLLLHFSTDRSAFDLLLQNLPLAGGRVDASVAMRPRERALFRLNAQIVPETSGGGTSWLWFLQPAADGSAAMSSAGSFLLAAPASAQVGSSIASRPGGAPSSDRSASLAAPAAAPRATSRSAAAPRPTGS
jgi:PAS domain-containing protein